MLEMAARLEKWGLGRHSAHTMEAMNSGDNAWGLVMILGNAHDSYRWTGCFRGCKPPNISDFHICLLIGHQYWATLSSLNTKTAHGFHLWCNEKWIFIAWILGLLVLLEPINNSWYCYVFLQVLSVLGRYHSQVPPEEVLLRRIT